MPCFPSLRWTFLYKLGTLTWEIVPRNPEKTETILIVGCVKHKFSSILPIKLSGNMIEHDNLCDIQRGIFGHLLHAHVGPALLSELIL